jgi:hypothetical protein
LTLLVMIASTQDFRLSGLRAPMGRFGYHMGSWFVLTSVIMSVSIYHAVRAGSIDPNQKN